MDATLTTPYSSNNKNGMKIFLLFLVLITGLIGCNKEKNLKSGDLLLILNDTTEIALHKVYTNYENSLSIKMDSILEDSRCPIGAQCVWSGIAGARFDFILNKKLTRFDLYTLNNLNYPVWHKDTIISGYKIQLIELNPYPSLLKHFKYGQYKAKIIISN